MDFLAFRSFISKEALIVFYYLGALVLPVAMWIFMAWLIRKYRLLSVAYEAGKEATWRSLNSRQRAKLMAFFMIAFAFAELFWRMLFEFLIAYMQMRDALLQMAV